ncbi:MAG: FAD-dependent oxidoreductase [Thermosipho sp. (in: Bacteria)]|nr:FAD-dependent oxidoreductase [Thermosipho sp. (in: thermotogales)]
MRWNVAVFGGGIAGISAAVNAYRSGKSVILVEQSFTIGGNATSGLVNPFMRYWLDNKILAGEFFQEILGDLKDYNARFKNTFDSEMLKIILFKKLEGVTLLFRSIPIEVYRKHKTIKKVIVQSSLGNRYEIEADLFIDATGDSTLAYLSGCKVESGDETGTNQATTLMFVIGNVDFHKVRESIRKDPDNFFKWVSPDAEVLSVAGYFKEIKKARKEGLTYPSDYFFFVQLPGEGRVTVNTTHIGVKTTDDFEVSKAMEVGHKQVYDVFRFSKEYVPGFENSYIEKIANILGIRESRRGTGLYKFKGNDVLQKSKFSDGVINACYGIDVHKKEHKIDKAESEFVPKYEDYYQIPLRALISKDVENLAVIGRGLSSDFLGQSAARIMPTCVDMGEVAGKLAGKVQKSFREAISEF